MWKENDFFERRYRLFLRLRSLAARRAGALKRAKTFGIGLSRTGTTSLTLALEALGLSAVHFPTTMKQIEEHDAATDTPVAASFQFLDSRFPGSKFIYTVRDLPEWLESCRRFLGKRQKNHFTANTFVANLQRHLYGGIDFDPERFRHAYARHDAQVCGHFAERPGDLLVIDICGGDTRWEPLCEFLGADVPDIPFPSTNASRLVDGVLVRLLHVIGDSKQIAAIAEVSHRYVENLRTSQAFRDHDRDVPLTLDAGWEVGGILAGACSYFGDADTAAQKLGIPKSEFKNTVERGRRL